ncbi:MAG: C25 family peptidase propeptide domain-containing protein, partial [Nitrospirota bacterium]
MIRILSGDIHKILLLLFVAIIIVVAGCSWPWTKPGQEQIRKQIVSHIGEVTEDSRFLGDSVTFKIYYKNTSRKKVTIGIIDDVPIGLTDVKPTQNGRYDANSNIILWELKDVEAGKGGFVEFQATTNKEKVISNHAYILLGIESLMKFTVSEQRKLDQEIKSLQLPKENVIKTNDVELTIYNKPKIGWIPFKENVKEEAHPRSNMKDETTMDVMINFDIPGMFVNEKQVDKVTYHELSIPMQATRMEIGKPRVPLVGRIVEVPKGVDFTVEIVEKESIRLKHYNVIPTQDPVIRQHMQTEQKKFMIDSATYRQSVMQPGDLAIVSPQDIGIVRGHRLVFLKAYPVQFNPITKEIEAFSRIEVKLKYSKPAQVKSVDARIYSPAFEDLLKNSVINYKDNRRFARGERPEKEVG